MHYGLAVAAAIYLGATCALGDVSLWSGDPNDVIITDDDVQITAPGTFKFQSVTGGNLDVIGSITVADGFTGSVTIHIARNPADSAGTLGATNVGEINLTNDQGTGLTGVLAELRITGDLGTGSATVVRNVTGVVTFVDTPNEITILGNLSGDIVAVQHPRLRRRQ